MKKSKNIAIVILIILLIAIGFVTFRLYKNYQILSNQKRNCKEIYERFEFIDFINIVKDYNPTKQWYEFAESTHKNSVVGASLDENGIALNVRSDGKPYYNPVTIAQYGLNCYGFYILTDDKTYLDEAIKQADYLVKIQNKKTGDFYYYFDYFAYGTNETLKSPWTSAMAIGNILSLYSRVYSITKDNKYLSSGELALLPLTKNVSDGGLVSYFNGHKFYEEYPTSKGNYTLNGFMFTLIGLYDFNFVTNNELSGKLYHDGIDTLKYILPYYDSADISLYHLAHLFYPNQQAYYNRKYHIIHIAQLELFYQIEKDSVFKHYADLWRSYATKEE